MSISSNTKQTTEPQKALSDKQGTQEDPRLKAIQKMVDTSSKFNEDAKQIVTLLENVPETCLFPRDFYIDYEDLLNEAIVTQKKTPAEAAEYAQKNFRVWRRLETDPEDATRTYAQTTYKVRLPNSTFPDMVRDLKLSSKNAIEALNKALMDVATKHDGEIIVKILKKKTGASKFNIKWEVTASPWNN
jgi:hypothetical protein